MASFPLRSAIEETTHKIYEDLKRECERAVVRKQRRSTRVPLRVEIEAQAIEEPVKCQGETVVVNCHGALISTSVALRIGTRIEVRVIPTDKHGLADVVDVNPEQPRLCGIGLVKPQNIWGVILPPEDWREADSQSISK